ncbi:unnamed protein product [Schistosoma margrebowiei]|uniref:Uncharacterized protein n=1 Tax=Schistosoma margrebowiei TaxID=48269 RepID=A0A183LRR0_9TREM|nr:unnamed protein product [Schistosoma margrebowiei]
MKMSISEGKHGIQQTSRMQMDDLDFADDLAFLSHTQQQMPEKMTNVAAASTYTKEKARFSDTTQHATTESHLTEKLWRILKPLHILAASLMNRMDLM